MYRRSFWPMMSDALESLVRAKLSDSGSLELRSETMRGRGLFARKYISADSCIHQEIPLCIMATSPHNCDSCRTPINADTRVVCSSCSCILWCEDCALKADRKHRLSGECAAFVTIDQEQTRAGRPRNQFWLRFAARSIIATLVAGSEWTVLLGLTSNDSRNSEEYESSDEAGVVIKALAQAFRRHRSVGDTSRLPDPRNIDQIFKHIGANAIAIYGSGGATGEEQGSSRVVEVAWGLYLVAAMINHSCNPSGSWSFDSNALMTIKTLRDIPPGEELEVSYIDSRQVEDDSSTGSTAPLAKRARGLSRKPHDVLGFTCLCELCDKQDAESFSSGDKK